MSSQFFSDGTLITRLNMSGQKPKYVSDFPTSLGNSSFVCNVYICTPPSTHRQFDCIKYKQKMRFVVYPKSNTNISVSSTYFITCRLVLSYAIVLRSRFVFFKRMSLSFRHFDFPIQFVCLNVIYCYKQNQLSFYIELSRLSIMKNNRLYRVIPQLHSYVIRSVSLCLLFTHRIFYFQTVL